MKNWRIVQHIFEGAETIPTLTHVFYGETRERAEQVFAAHMKTDSFMSACVLNRRFRNFSCRAESYTERIDAKGQWRCV